ncbi:MATE family efflux transporter [Anaerostipes sp. 992a]|uniref:MATE family efflux transporter n=1 Tax=Anaerostipes sp. 992a TaxID=1261637 RepID=UPI000952ABDC|nr:MATE family efflux transporter [Anaerostipes sp. 992a]OLR66020.1 MATE family efflux transporter [Anaerostipes sp. 992a]
MAEQAAVTKNDFSKGSVWGNIIAQAVPLTIAQLVQLLYNIVDRMYIGHMEGSSSLALTGIGLTFPIVMLVMAFTNLFGQGGAPLCSIARGAGDKERAENIMGNSFTMLLMAGMAITMVGYVCKRPILYAFGASDVTYVYAEQYLNIYLAGTMFLMISVGMNHYINSQGFPKIGMLSVIIGAVVNIILDPIMIFGMDLGIRGAALATVISQFVSAVWVMKFLLGKKTLLKLSLKSMKLRPKLDKEIMGLGLTGFILQGTNGLVHVVCNATLSVYGGDLYVGINTVLGSVRDIFQLPIQGITSGCQPVLGFNYGAKEYGRVKEGIRFTVLVGSFYTVVAWILIFLFPEFFIRIFNNDPELIRYGVKALHIYFFGFFMMAFQFCGQSVFTGLGKAKQAVFFSIFRKVIIVVPLTILLPQMGGLGVHGVFLAEPISNAIGGLACFTTMYFTVYRKLD